jgi:hypothetical protein
MSQQAVSADSIPNSAVGIFSPKTEGTKTQEARVKSWLPLPHKFSLATLQSIDS